MSDRKLGYIILFLLLFFFIAIALHLIKHGSSPSYTRKISFDQIGALNVQDPVLIDGVEAGLVHDVTSVSGKVIVTIKLFKSPAIREGYTIELKPKGVMGDRFIKIAPGLEPAPLINKDVVLQGIFKMGPPEALAYVLDLHEVVKNLSNITTDLHRGNQNKQSFIEQFEKITIGIDSVGENMLNFLSSLDKDFSEIMDSFSIFIEKTRSASDSISLKVPEILNIADEIVRKIEEIMNQLDNVATLSKSAVDPFIDSTHAFWGDQLEEMQINFKSLRDALKTIQTEGLYLPVRPRW